MHKNLQFLDDPDDVPYINQNITLSVGVNGSDTENDGSSDSPFRTLGKAIDVVRNKQIKKDSIVTIDIGSAQTDRVGSKKKYFEEEEIKIDFETAKRLKIRGVKPTDHEILGINYYDLAKDRDGYYCQVIVSNQDKICIGDYLAIYDHLKVKKKDSNLLWVDNAGGGTNRSARLITPSNCYIEAIRGEMILGVHEVVDVSDTIEHIGAYENLATELFYPQGLKIGAVTLHIKNHNHTYNRLNEVPFYSTLGVMGGKPLFTYAAGAGNSPLQAKQNNSIPPIFYGAEMLSNPETAEANGYEQFYYASPVQQIELADIMVRGYGISLKPLDNVIFDPRTGNPAKDANLLWNDKSLNGYNRAIVAGTIASYFYKKLIKDLGIEKDLPFYFGKSSNPFITMQSIITASKKIRDYLLVGASQINGVPSWEEENHPGYGFGPFESSAVRENPSLPGSGANVDTGSYPQEYADNSKYSILLRYYDIYPPINGQLYGPILVKRIRSWYNDNASKNGIQLDRWELKGNKSPFFCGYITPQGWYKKQFSSDPAGTAFTTSTPSLSLEADTDGYHRLSGVTYPVYVGNSLTSFKSISDKSRGAFSNDRTSAKNLPLIDQANIATELLGITSPNENANGYKGSMGTVWYAGTVNGDSGVAVPGAMGTVVYDRYSLGYRTGESINTNDYITTKGVPISEQDEGTEPRRRINNTQSTMLRAKCFKSVLRFSGNGICVKSKTKLALIKDVCIVHVGKIKSRDYGILVDQESVLNASNIAVSSFSCGISARNQSLINLLADLKDTTDTSNKGILSAVDPAAFTSANEIGIESITKSHVNARRSVSTGSLKANYLAAANSSMDCTNSMSVGGHKHGIVSEWNSYINAVNCISEFNGGVGFCSANNSILVCHRGRSIWNGSHGVLAATKGNIRCYEFISRSNNGDGFLAKQKSVISAGANSSNWINYRREILDSGFKLVGDASDGYGIRTMLPPHLYQTTIVAPQDVNFPIRLPFAAPGINSNPSYGINVLYHECNSTISEFNAGSGFASETDSLIIADNTISRYNSKINGEFFIYGWSGTRGAFPTDTFAPFEGVV